MISNCHLLLSSPAVTSHCHLYPHLLLSFPPVIPNIPPLSSPTISTSCHITWSSPIVISHYHHQLSSLADITSCCVSLSSHIVIPTVISHWHSTLSSTVISDCHILLSFSAVIFCCHPLLSSPAVIPCCHLLLSPPAVIPCCHLLLSPPAVIFCCHPLLSSSAVTPCCYPLLPSSAVIPCCHLLLSPPAVIPCCYPLLSSPAVIFCCRPLLLSDPLSSLTIIYAVISYDHLPLPSLTVSSSQRLASSGHVTCHLVLCNCDQVVESPAVDRKHIMVYI